MWLNKKNMELHLSIDLIIFIAKLQVSLHTSTAVFRAHAFIAMRQWKHNTWLTNPLRLT